MSLSPVIATFFSRMPSFTFFVWIALASMTVLLILAGSAISRANEVTVLASSVDGFHCHIALDPTNFDWGYTADSALVPFYTLQVGIPNGAKVELLSASGISEQPSNQLSQPVQNHAIAAMPELAKVGRPMIVRGHILVGVRIYPVHGKSYYQEVDLSLRFIGGSKSAEAAIADPAFDRLMSAAVANYDAAKAWKTIPEPITPTSAVNEFSNSAVWCKATVGTSGVYRITGAQLAAAGISLTGLVSDSIRLFGGSGLPLPVPNDSARPAFQEIAVQMHDGGDGSFGANDTLLFFGESVERYTYSQTGTPIFVSNPYTDRNVYWISIGGSYAAAPLRMANVNSAPGASDTTITTFNRTVHAEQNVLLRRYNDNEIPEYYTWYWTSNRNFTFFAATPGYIAGDSAKIFLYGQTFDTLGNGPQSNFMDLRVNNVSGANKNCSIDSCYFRSTQLHDGLNTFDVALYPISYAPGYLDYVDIRYRSRLAPVSNQLDMQFAPFTGTATVNITDNLTGTPMLWNVTDAHTPFALTNFTRTTGTLSCNTALSAGSYTRLYLATSATIQSPLAIQKVQPVDLRAATSQTDLLVITPKNFVSALNEYVNLRETQGAAISVVSVEDIMDNFSWGLYDPTAIRDFLKYAYEHYSSPAPTSVLMVGDGSYDYRNFLNTGVANIVPPYIHALDASVSDDNYVYFGAYGILDSDTSYFSDNRGYDMLTSRWPVTSTSQINAIVNKIKTYEATTNLGEWRQKITLVADDEFGTYSSESFHTIQTEELSKNHIPTLFNQNKIYLWDYPFVGTRKPSVNDKIVQTINDGTLLLNYVGHGNPELFSDEFVFTRSGDLPRLQDATTLPLFFAASCAIGFFDDPRRVGMAEDLLTMPENGAIAVVSATRLVFSSPNAQFNQKVFDILLYGDSLTIAEAVYAAKLQRQYASSTPPDPVVNDRAYIYLGDPLLKLGRPHYPIVIDERPDSLQALAVTTVSGHLVDFNNAPLAGNGTLHITVYDSKRQRLHTVQQSQEDVTYEVPGPQLYHGTAPITNGSFSVPFVLPLDVTFGGSGARISLYATIGTEDGAVSIDSLPISGSIASSNDSSGPQITIGFTQVNSFVDGGVIAPNSALLLNVNDPSGINLTTGQGHEITLEIDGDTQHPISLSASFVYDAGSYTAGSLQYNFASLAPGEHRFKIKAWDNANNSSVTEVTANVLMPGSFAIRDLLNYPNPMKEITSFSFLLTQPAKEVDVEIFTLSGRRIQHMTLSGPLAARRYTNVLNWDGKDALAGDRVATGVYIYKATAHPVSGSESVESFGKVIVVN